MRILAIGDLHGKVPAGMKQFIKKNKIDAILSCGDFSKSYTRDLIWKRRKQGPITGTYGEEFGINRWNALVKKETLSAMRVLRRLNSLGIPIITVYGNAETSRRAWWWRIEAPNQPCIEQYGLDRLRNVMLLEFAKARLYDWTIYGFGCRFTSEISGSKRLGPVRVAAIRGRERRALQKFFKTANPTKTIILVHAPPYGVLDVVKEKGSFRHRQHVGDDILRDFIKRRKPAMILCGHLHEWAQKTARIGRTLVVNPGYGHDGEAAIIQLPTLKVNFVKIPGKKAKQ